MMKAFKMFYLSIYFAVRKDKNWSKTERVTYLIDTALLMICSSVLFILAGVFNIRTDNLKTISIVVIAALITSHLVGRIILGKGKEQVYIQSAKNYDLKKKRILAVWGILFFVLSFVVMILSAILMSYLWGKNLF